MTNTSGLFPVATNGRWSWYWWHEWTPHPFVYICSQTVLLPRTLRSRSGSRFWGIEGAPRRQGGSIERGSESAQISPTTEPNPTDLRAQRRHKKREGKVEREPARVFYMRLSQVRLKIQFNDPKIWVWISSEIFFLEIFTRNDRIYPYKKPEWDFTSEIIETRISFSEFHSL